MTFKNRDLLQIRSAYQWWDVRTEAEPHASTSLSRSERIRLSKLATFGALVGTLEYGVRLFRRHFPKWILVHVLGPHTMLLRRRDHTWDRLRWDSPELHNALVVDAFDPLREQVPYV